MARAAETAFTGVSDQKSGDLTWSITADGHLTVTGKGDYKPIMLHVEDSDIEGPEWLRYHKHICTANIDVQDITSTKYMFYYCVNLTSIHLINLDTSNVTNMCSMFKDCSSLSNLDVSNFDTHNVTNMYGIFWDCSNLNDLDVSKFKTSNVTDMRFMFRGCSNLGNLNISNFDTSNVTNMAGMFEDCNSLSNLDVSNFDTRNVTSMGYMFDGCSGLSNLNVSNFITSNATSMDGMFWNCSSLNSLDLSNFDTSNVTNMFYMFFNCDDLSNLDISNFDTSNVTSMYGMFAHCSNLTSLDVSKFKTGNVTSMYDMFQSCDNLSSLDVSNFDTHNVTNMGRMFFCCSNLTSIDVSNFDTSNVTSMYGMFHGCNSINSLDLGNFNTCNVTSMLSMFYGCSNLSSLDLSNFNTSNVTNMEYMFSYCSNLSSLDISNFNTTKIKYEDVDDGEVYGSGSFSLTDLESLEKLYFFADSLNEYVLPSSMGYHWVDENNEICTKTSKIDRKMTYTLVPTDTPTPSASPVITSDVHIFNDYDYTSPVTGAAIVIYGNGKVQKIDGKKVNNKMCVVYTDILASYKYTPNSNGTVKASSGKVIVGITKSDTKPIVSSKNKITDTSASKIAKTKIKNGQITVTAVGKEGGLIYLWVIDTGNKGVSACCPINVKLAPTKMEIQNTSGSKLAKNTELENGKILDVCVEGLVAQTKTDDGTYTAKVASKHQSYVSVNPVEGSTNKFTINAKGLKNNKDTKVTVTFKCDQNDKKTNLSLIITK